MPPMVIEYQYTTAFARRATWSFLRRYGRQAFWLAGAAFAVGAVRVLLHLIDSFCTSAFPAALSSLPLHDLARR